MVFRIAKAKNSIKINGDAKSDLRLIVVLVKKSQQFVSDASEVQKSEINSIRQRVYTTHENVHLESLATLRHSSD